MVQDELKKEPPILEVFLYSVLDVYAEYELNKKILEPVSKTCFKGCGACCHFPMVPVTLGEAVVFSQRILASEINKEKFFEDLRSYVEHYLNYALQNDGLPVTQKQQKAYLAQKKVCPLFLSTGPNFEGSCSVFSIKPLICDYYHSLDNPLKCAKKLPHASDDSLIQLGLNSTEEIRLLERETWGFSVLGHLPLLLAYIFTTPLEHVFKFVSEGIDFSDCNTEAERQSWKDFSMYCECLKALGYEVSAQDLRNLAQAQEEFGQSEISH